MPGKPGSPPHVRGKGYHRPERQQLARITPAYAGKSLRPGGVAGTRQDHPRMCGEKIRSFTCGSACRSGRIMPGISSISVSSAHNGHQSKAIGLAAPYALTQQRPELLCIGHL